MRESPLRDPRPVLDFATRLGAGEFDVVIFLTGVGFRLLLRALEGRPERDPFLAALPRVITVVHGPKQLAAMREVGLEPTHRVPEPNTWRDVLTTLDREVAIPDTRVAIQEYGLPNTALVAGLRARGAAVTSVPVYQWALPADTGPLEANARRIAAGEIDVVLFTSSQQVVHLLQIARERALEAAARAALQRHVVVASIGPTTSETLRTLDLPVDLEPKRPKMGHLVNAVAVRAHDLIAGKRR